MGQSVVMDCACSRNTHGSVYQCVPWWFDWMETIFFHLFHWHLSFFCWVPKQMLGVNLFFPPRTTSPTSPPPQTVLVLYYWTGYTNIITKLNRLGCERKSFVNAYNGKTIHENHYRLITDCGYRDIPNSIRIETKTPFFYHQQLIWIFDESFQQKRFPEYVKSVSNWTDSYWV